MQPQHFRFGGGAPDTMIHPIVLIAMIIAIILIFTLKRKNVVVPFFAVIFLSPFGQVLVIAGVHIFVYRILILFGFIRLITTKMSSGEDVLPGGFNALDKFFSVWAIARAVAPIILFKETAAAINSFGFIWDVFGGYFLLRFLIQDKEDIYRVFKTLGVVTAILTVFILNEKFRDQNVFGYIGGVPVLPDFRDGSIRPQAAFSQPLLAGTFGATLLPIFFLLWQSGKSRVVGIIGMICSTIITIASASSTPLMAYAAAVLALCFWPLRKKMRLIRWGIVLLLIALQMVMKAPVWFIITHIDIIGASSGYHRAALIDHFIRNFGSWWLVGTADNANWGWDMWDMANQYVAEGQSGGLVAFVAFIGMISVCFGWIGKARKLVEGDRHEEWFLWLLGAALFSNVIGFFGISYFDQTRYSWFTLLIAISVATITVWTRDVEPVRDYRPQPALRVSRSPVHAAPLIQRTQSVTARRWS